jgi:acyl-CoA hydrolase
MRIRTAEQLHTTFSSFRSRPRVVVSGNAATPWTVLRLLDEAVEEYVLHLLGPYPGVPNRSGVVLETAFVGPGARRSPQLSYVPSRLSMLPVLYSDPLVPDIVLLRTSVPRGGAVSMGIEVNVLPAAVEAVRARGGLVVCQLDRAMPYTFGDGELSTDHVDWAIEASDVLGSPAVSAPDAAAERIAEQVAGQIADGATIQIGIGEVPDAVVGGLMDRRELRVWSEMISDGVLALERAGRLNQDVAISASFLLGSPELYRWADLNPRLRLLRTETTNDPARIARNPAMVSINTALQVDLFAQVNASRIKGRIHSGFGGQTDFIVGALHAPGGQAVIALKSWHAKADVSTIVPMVEEPVTSFQPSSVVTEQGAARLRGHNEKAQARHLIDRAAHPSMRDELREEAQALGLA